ncbi:MAG: PEP/pyruvate-binding domain-containing protein [Candidatus Ozemobacteraceae bacterium]
MSSRIIGCQERPEPRELASTGGKGGNLLKLTAGGARVPPFIVLTSRCFDEFLTSCGEAFAKELAKLDLSNTASIAATSTAFRAFIKRQRMPEAMVAEIEAAFPSVIGDGFAAVRSSALGEDSKEFSYAGMLDSILFCKGREEVIAAVLDCWASLYSDRAVAYRHMRGQAQTGISMAVVVQKMIDGAASGVTFTVNPVSKYEDELSINAVPGLGEGLVSGGLNADGFVCIKREGFPIDTREIVEKTERIVFDRDRGWGTKTEPIPAADAMKPCLTDAHVAKVAQACVGIEKQYGGMPLDIEWTIDPAGDLYILQARPITTIDHALPSDRDHSILWDNSNIVESYSGVTTPLTFSFALNAYHMVYVQFCQVLRVPEEVIQENDFAFANMLGLLNGRIYYNLKNWYRLVSVLPGYKYNARFMEGMMGVKAKFEFDPAGTKKPLSWFERYFVELPRLAMSGASLAWQFYTIDAKVKSFMQIYERMYEKYKDFDFNAAPAGRIVEVHKELENTVLRNWKAPIINDFMAMIFYGVLKSLMSSWNLDPDGSLQNDLVAGQGNVESTLPLRSLQDIARFVVPQPVLLQIIKQEPLDALVKRFITQPCTDATGPERELTAKLAEYLVKYGYRAMNELKLEEPSLNEKPEYIFSILKNYVAAPLPPAIDSGAHERELREIAERKVGEILKGQKLFGLISKESVLRFVANYAKKAMAVREYQRFARTKMYGLVRRMFLGFGRRFVERDILDHADDVFYLTQEEVLGYTVGCAPSQKLRELAAVRKAEFAAYSASDELPDRIETRGIVYANDLTKSVLKAVETGDPNILKGIGGCSGKVRGRVKVILKPSDDMVLNGEILVAARTDPGWVPLFPSASGLLIERGSMLSHSVIVARELGLPAIVGISDVTKRLKTGDLVEMDGTTGIVRIIPPEEASK